MQAGIEMGLRPKDAMQMIAQSLKGAAALIQNNDTHPSVEIDKVTTPRNHNQRDQRTGAQRLYFRHYQSDESSK